MIRFKDIAEGYEWCRQHAAGNCYFMFNRHYWGGVVLGEYCGYFVTPVDWE